MLEKSMQNAEVAGARWEMDLRLTKLVQVPHQVKHMCVGKSQQQQQSSGSMFAQVLTERVLVSPLLSFVL
jgi:hypothetical protein